MPLRTAARELGLKHRELDLAIQLDVVGSVPGTAGSPRKVPRGELDRIRGTGGGPERLRERLHTVGAAEGAALLGISPARFARLAKAGAFRPVRFYLNRYRTVVWLYLAEELRDFAERNPELLTGRFPDSVRKVLAEGADRRARLWRHRRVGQLARLAGDAWERAAARAAVLDEDILAEAVPDVEERALLRALRPRLADVPGGSPATQETVAELCLAEGDEETLWHRVTLLAELEEGRAQAAREAGQTDVPPGDTGQRRSPELALPRGGADRDCGAQEKKRWRPWSRRGKIVSRPAF